MKVRGEVGKECKQGRTNVAKARDESRVSRKKRRKFVPSLQEGRADRSALGLE